MRLFIGQKYEMVFFEFGADASEAGSFAIYVHLMDTYRSSWWSLELRKYNAAAANVIKL